MYNRSISRDLAKHHDVALLPPRSGSATDKAKVEAAGGAIVGPNGHMRVGRNDDSVPDGHVGRGVAVRVGERM